ncbi:MAG TPA: sulfotransferase [Vicinamibacterales bacterium]|nr:sulfotransferase [Vicinamibacterales bacterium]
MAAALQTSAVNTQPPFFVIGSPRSGTTLLRNLLRSHPALAVSPESHFVPILYRAAGDPVDERSRTRLIRRILNTHWVRGWRIEARVEDFDGCVTYADIVMRLYRIAAGPKRDVRQGDKTPGYAREIPTLERIFPGSQYIHIIRDGRDVALSLAQVWFGHRHVYTAAHYWRDHVLDARRDGRPLGPGRYLEIFYEDLLRDTERTMRTVCEFLGEPFDPCVLVPTPIRQLEGGQALGWVTTTRRPARMISSTEVIPSNTDKWRTHMPRRDVEIFETAAGDLLEELGYERVTNGRRIGALQRGYWVVSEFVHRALGYASRNKKRIWVPSEIVLLWSRLRGRLMPASLTRSLPRES